MKLWMEAMVSAAQSGHNGIVWQLPMTSISTEARDMFSRVKYTPLHSATRSGYIGTVEL